MDQCSQARPSCNDRSIIIYCSYNLPQLPDTNSLTCAIQHPVLKMAMALTLLQNALSGFGDAINIGHIDIDAEQEAEIETLDNCNDMIEAEETASKSGEQYLGDSDSPESLSTALSSRPDFVSMVKEASADVVVKSTRNEYQRYVIYYKGRFQ